MVDGTITNRLQLVMRSDIATSIHVQPLAIDNHNPTTAPPICGVSTVSTLLSLSASPPRSSSGLDSNSTTIPSALHPHCRRGHLHHRATQQHPTSAYYTATTNSSSRSQSSGYCRCWSWYYYCCSHCVIPTIPRRTKILSTQLGLHNNKYSFTEFPEYSCLKL